MPAEGKNTRTFYEWFYFNNVSEDKPDSYHSLDFIDFDDHDFSEVDENELGDTQIDFYSDSDGTDPVYAYGYLSAKDAQNAIDRIAVNFD